MKSIDRFSVSGHNDWKLAHLDPNASPDCADKAEAAVRLEKLRLELIGLQDKLYAGCEYGILLVLQGLDTSGKDGTIRNVMSGVNPQGCHVSSFKVPSAVEANHDYLWRIHHSAPARGRFVIFNRSHYEDVVAARVHSDRLPEWAKKRKELWKERYEQINNFEKHLWQNNIVTVKCFLHISKDEQQARLAKRLADPAKNWKFSSADVAERKLWDEYMKVYDETLHHTSTEWAPWHVVPANKKWYRNIVVAELVVDALRKLKLAYPKADPEELKRIVIE